MNSMERVRLLQLKLYLKAKQESGYKYYVLYDKIFQAHILGEAYMRSKSKNGSPESTKQSFKDVEKYGRKKFLTEISEELRKRIYKPQAVKRKWIDKYGGGQRPLGIPTIKDRVVQQACKIVIEPIFEADFADLSYGFRPKRSAKGAITEIRNNLKKGNHTVYDADLSKYFDTIPHDKLEIVLKERIADPRVLHLIKLWLKVPIVEEDGRYTGGKSNTKGTPQGGVISSLLANIYLNLLDRIVNNPKGYFTRRGIRMIRYADDFILMSKHINQETLIRVHNYLERMGLTINTDKSKLVNAEEKSFDFLGFTFGYDRSLYSTGGRFWNINQSKFTQNDKTEDKSKIKINRTFFSRKSGVGVKSHAKRMDELFKIEKVSYTQVAFRELEDYLRIRLYRYYNRKSQRKSRLYGQQAFEKLVKDYGLIKPYVTSGKRPAKAL